jgi:SAM-dependent methyltransferase
LKRAHRALKPGGRIALATWAPPDRNPWAATAVNVLKRHAEIPAPPPGAPGLFAMSDPERLLSLLYGAGFKDVKVDATPVGRDYGTGQKYFQFTFDLAGPLAVVYSQLSPEKKAKVAEEVAAEAEKLRKDGKLFIPGVAWVASGAK